MLFLLSSLSSLSPLILSTWSAEAIANPHLKMDEKINVGSNDYKHLQLKTPSQYFVMDSRQMKMLVGYKVISKATLTEFESLP